MTATQADNQITDLQQQVTDLTEKYNTLLDMYLSTNGWSGNSNTAPGVYFKDTATKHQFEIRKGDTVDEDDFDAKEACRKLNPKAKLATIQNNEEKEILKNHNFINSPSPTFLWVNAVSPNKNWKWGGNNIDEDSKTIDDELWVSKPSRNVPHKHAAWYSGKDGAGEPRQGLINVATWKSKNFALCELRL